MCYDGCWDTTKKIGTFYVNIIGHSHEEIEQYRERSEIKKNCEDNIPPLGQWERQLKAFTVESFICKYFKH